MAAFLKGDGETAAAMYATINGFRAQENALKAAASRALQGRDLDTFLDVLAAVKPLAKTRHHFAHWLWGVCDTLPNHNLLVPPQALWKYHAAARASLYADAGADEMPQVDRSEIQVWSVEGLAQAAMDMDLCADLVAVLVTFLELPEGTERELLYQQMYHQSLMQRAHQKRLGKS
ncbi:hypothetical protein [Asaia bogorensis]|uniref:hypothetical protein n=1 Tax=Asaia bogorensis TaxID=91915 RepID=UPI00301990B5